MRVKQPERAYSFSPSGNDTIKLCKELGFPVRFDIVFERRGITYTTAKALIVEGETLTLWEKGEKTVGSLQNLYFRLYRQFGRGIRLVPRPV